MTKCAINGGQPDGHRVHTDVKAAAAERFLEPLRGDTVLEYCF